MYAIQDVPGKGKGLVATQFIPMGTRILSEKPILRVPEDKPDSQALRESLSRQVDALTQDQRQAFLSMHNIHTDESASKYLGIIRTNALPFGRDEAGIFLDACRINHACDNNAQKCWNGNIKRHTVHALKNINLGEEITIYYLGVTNNREARQDALRRKFARLNEILKLDLLIGRDGLMGILSDPLQKLRHVDRQVTLYNEQGPNDAGLPRAFLDAAQIAVANGDLARARIFTEKAMLGWVVLGGDDGPNVLENKALSKDPSKHMLYGHSMKWKTSIDDTPSGLDPAEFDNWLWKREKPQQPGQPTDFRNQTTFPPFNDLPSDKFTATEFDTSSDETTHRPSRHWVFLAEIVDFFTLARLQMDVKDVDGTTVPLFFYTDGRGRELTPSKVQKGYTVAILYAQRHEFMFSEPGIRLEKSSNIKIFPTSLGNLLALNDQVQNFSVEANGMRTCHGCGKPSATLKKCAKCSLFWYCNRACQIRGWNEKGHKADCKILRDADLKGLFSPNWNTFEGHVGFPLNNVTA
ncbi:hypothetical protein V496_07798 [Pseudogymnoascus sp. VKM F-4515 (FW-2607)]|nr:hypothetical protein V496_07798 [Pseudogymnoascus sp. VKM F-4515 (FW-2607)]